MPVNSNYPTIQPSLDLDFANTRSLDPRITFSRASTAVYYDTNTSVKAEENLWTSSDSIGSAIQSVANTITNNVAVAPNGTTTASLVVPTAVNTRHYCGIRSATAQALNVPYTGSIYVKASGYNYVFIQLSGARASGGSRYGVTFNVGTGVIETGGATFLSNVTNTSSSITSIGNGWYRCTLTANFTNIASEPLFYVQAMPTNGTGYPLTDGLPSYLGNGTSGAYFWGFQLEQRSTVTAYISTTTVPITTYQPVLLTAPANSPRFDCNPVTRESLGLLIEESRTNLALYSSDMSNPYYVFAGATRTRNVVAPDGTISGTMFSGPTVGVAAFQVIATSTSMTYSVYAKIFSGVSRIFAMRNNTTATNFDFGVFNPDGTITGTGWTSKSVGNGWYRLSYGRTTGITVGNSLNLYFGAGSTITTYDGQWAVWGAQVEAGAFATSYIATTVTTATRSADSASMTGTNFSSWYRADEGTLYGEASTNSVGNASATLWNLNSGSYLSNSLFRYSNYGTTPTTTLVFGYSVSALDIDMRKAATAIAGVNNKSATAIKANDYAYVINGGTPATDTSAGIPVVTQLQIGSLVGGAANQNGTIKKIAYYPIRVTNANLQALTGS